MLRLELTLRQECAILVFTVQEDRRFLDLRTISVETYALQVTIVNKAHLVQNSARVATIILLKARKRSLIVSSALLVNIVPVKVNLNPLVTAKTVITVLLHHP